MARFPARSSAKGLELSGDDAILHEAQQRFKIGYDWESDFQTLAKDDIKFYHGDSDNGWQWPRDLKKEREDNKRPSLTINKTKDKCNRIINDMYENKPGVKIIPTGDEATFEAAQAYEDIVRQIEYVSNAPSIYDAAARDTVKSGIGWWRVGTRYADDDTFDQEIILLPVKDSLSIILDPNIQKDDGSDARWGFVFDEVPKEEAEKEWPDADLTSQPAIEGPASWVNDNNVRIAEYFRIVEKDDELIYAEDKEGNDATFRKSDLPRKGDADKLLKKIEKEGGTVKRRPIKVRKLEWFKIVGNSIVDRRAGNDAYPYRYIPLVRSTGIEDAVDGKLVRYGHVRALKDPQRMYNYNSSGQVEFGALATKTPWVIADKAIEGHEDDWNSANIKNFAYLKYNHYDLEAPEEGAIPPPQRPEAPGVSPAFVQGMDRAEHEMDMASGQYEAKEGRPGNERSGKAIGMRARQGDVATYHFVNSQALAIRYTGIIILDMFPHVYDTKRVIQAMAKSGQQRQITIDPNAAQLLEKQKTQQDVLEIVFNPKKGAYLVEADTGPSYATARQEAWDAFVQLVSVNGELYNEIGDLMFKSADFPMANDIADRLRRKIRAEKPYLFDDNAPTPQQQMMEQQIQMLSKQVEDLLHSLAKKDLKLVGKEQMRDIDAYRAETDRIGTLANAQPELSRMGIDPELAQLVLKTIAQANGMDLTDLVQFLGGEFGQEPPAEQDQIEQQEQPPVPGAEKAPDGSWYVEQNGQMMRVDPAQQ